MKQAWGLDSGDELVGVIDSPKGEVGLFADFKRSDLILQSESAGSIDGCAEEAFCGSKAEKGASHVEGEE